MSKNHGVGEMPGLQSFDKKKSPIKFSVVLPIYNEIENLPQLFEEISTVMRQTAATYEIICINDGSTDHSPAYI